MDHLDRTVFWELFQETGDPMGYVLYAAQARKDGPAEDCTAAVWTAAQNTAPLPGEQHMPKGCR